MQTLLGSSWRGCARVEGLCSRTCFRLKLPLTLTVHRSVVAAGVAEVAQQYRGAEYLIETGRIMRS